MELKGSYRLPAARDKVWAALADPSLLQTSIPGCEQVSVNPLDERELRFVIAADIGGFKAVFTGQARLVAAQPPHRATISGEGRGRPGGSASGSADVELSSVPGGTMVSFTGTADVGGKLASIAPDIIVGKAKALADEFFAAIASWLEGTNGSFVDQMDHAPAGVPKLGDDPSEGVVEDTIERGAEVAEAIEERIEVAAGNGFLGGPYVWGLLALIVVILLLSFQYS